MSFCLHPITLYCTFYILILFIYALYNDVFVLYSSRVILDLDVYSSSILVNEADESFSYDPHLSRSYEVKSDCATPVVSVKGRLKKAVQSWVDIDAPQFILDVISEGYRIPFFVLPLAFIGKNNKSALREFSFVEQSIKELLDSNCVEEVFSPPVIINPLSVSIQSSGKKRLILDLRHVNKCVYKNKFRCEDLVVLGILKPGDFIFTFDLKSGYHHVEIFEGHRNFLSFSWKFPNGCVSYFHFAVLPFGLSSAPYLFTKLFKPLVKMWRSRGTTIMVYLDDGLGASSNEIACKIVSLQVHSEGLVFSLMNKNVIGIPLNPSFIWELTLIPSLVLFQLPPGELIVFFLILVHFSLLIAAMYKLDPLLLLAARSFPLLIVLVR